MLAESVQGQRGPQCGAHGIGSKVPGIRAAARNLRLQPLSTHSQDQQGEIERQQLPGACEPAHHQAVAAGSEQRGVHDFICMDEARRRSAARPGPPATEGRQLLPAEQQREHSGGYDKGRENPVSAPGEEQRYFS